jgi:putative phage-type endonuclease
MLRNFEEINANSPKQREQAWHDVRRGCVNASELGAITGVSKYNTAKEVIRSKILLSEEDTYPVTSSDAMQWGSKFEAVSKYLIEKKYGAPVLECASFAHPSFPFIRGSPDGMFVAADGVYTCEFKTPYNRVPTHLGPSNEYYQQIQTVLDICKTIGAGMPIVGCKFLDISIRRCSLRQLQYPTEAARHTYREEFIRHNDASSFPHALMFYVTGSAGSASAEPIDFALVPEADLTYNKDYELHFAGEWTYPDEDFRRKEYPQFADEAQVIANGLREKFGPTVVGFVCFKVFQVNLETVVPDRDYWAASVLPSAIRYGELLTKIRAEPSFEERNRLFNEAFPDEEEEEQFE